MQSRRFQAIQRTRASRRQNRCDIVMPHVFYYTMLQLSEVRKEKQGIQVDLRTDGIRLDMRNTQINLEPCLCATVIQCQEKDTR